MSASTLIIMALPGDERLLAALGRLSIRHGQLEYHLRMTVRTLKDCTIEHALDSTERMSASGLRKLVRKLAVKRTIDAQVISLLDSLLGRIAAATDRRNELLHGLWAHELDGRPVFRSKGLAFEGAPSVAAVENVEAAVLMAAKELIEARLDGFLKKALSNSN